ncbi:MAG: NAD(P)-binding domain-containing protein [Oscillospiraceae bacterium]|jgi:pyrroline-5-carboxylate reductase|nr:NAD(P)-binding domain-containing protein [Oscillospiraceae bacterium]
MKISIIGVGNLGKSLLSGLTNSGTPLSDVTVLARPERVAEVSASLGVAATDDINAAFYFADVIFLVVKGHVFSELAPQLKQPVASNKTVVSFMAGVPFEKIYSQIGDCRLVRAMPSLAIAANDGVIGYTAAPPEVEKLLQGLGYAFEVASEDIEKVTAFSGCGLGFAAYLIDAFARAGRTLGFSAEQADKIAAQTFRNAVERGEFAKTVRQVATKGGATELGVAFMDLYDTYGIISGAVGKAYEKMK